MMTLLEGEAVHVEDHVSQWCDTANEVLAMKPLPLQDKVRQFFEEQDCQQQPVLEVALDGEVQDAALGADLAPVDEEQSGTKSLHPRRRNVGKGSDRQPSSRKRKRQGETVEDDQMLLFRRSQKALRKEARHVNIKEVLCRSLSGTVDAPSDTSNPFSPPCSSPLSSTWSPSIAANITNRFLSNVHQQRKQTFERLLHRELTNSQLSFSRPTTDDGESNGCFPELVISEDTAIMEPPTNGNKFLAVEASKMGPHPIEGAGAGSNSLFSLDAPNVGSNTLCSFNELDDEAEQAQSEALMRKHEIWRLRQRQLRTQISTEGVTSYVKWGDETTLETPMPAASAGEAPLSLLSLSSSSSAVVNATRVSATDADGSFDVFTMVQRSVKQRSHSATFGLSADHVSMIRRVNNFDNTSSQRVVVFDTKRTQQGKALPSVNKQ